MLLVVELTFYLGYLFQRFLKEEFRANFPKAMNEKINPDNEALDPSDEYWRQQSSDEEDEPYFPPEESKPPHY
ncbi:MULTISPECIES: hypothetical protein [unclassified Prochlorococcus]|uniref:hypothetical protein n=1 Tax=unclassified Prochlorococcus TaxID=2627481 RepID=UPI000533B31C|nr:hypothetical protein [Prochlorococcus sp. MIT 0602]KGG14887.1 hypothetical protein EV06_1950 [Prochlorococcus sp. MIT 0602]KGG15681.1 hypothetical protein EV07_1646 [Prochlorococcus sp. MIT 0603]